MKTSELIVRKYDWYIIPPSVHKLLEHGYLISEYFELPIGVYSEEAQEACNKIVRKARLNHAVKISRRNTKENQIHYLLQRSDPLVSSVSFVAHKNSLGVPLEADVLSLLVE